MGVAKSQGGLGVRNLVDFNHALLGKHVWNFINNHNSLVARVFKARYYPNTHLLQASRGGGSSYVWSDIWETKEKLKTGFRWILGDGETICAFKDPWLRGKDNFCVDGHYQNSTSTMKVNNFFRPNTKEWDEERVQTTFNSTDAKVILETRIPQIQCRDRLAWTVSKDGKYSVKSGYHFGQSSTELSHQMDQTTGWKRLWNLNVPQKLKIFLWRFCKNVIPVRNLLRHKGVQVSIICPQCDRDVEHKLHVFFDCDYATQCWQEVGMNLDMRREEYAPNWLLSRLQSDTQDNIVNIAAVLWGIWFARNRRIWEGKVISLTLAVQGSFKLINEWRDAVKKVQNMSTTRCKESNTDNVVRWKCPEEGGLKVNVDASMFPGADSFTIGIVMRDHTGSFQRGRTATLLGNVSVFEAEAVGFLEALSWVKDISDVQVTVESDSLMVVSALQKLQTNQLEVGHVLEACRLILSSRSNFRVVHVKKLANKAAHMMARLPCSPNSFIEYKSPPPSVLETIVYDSR